MDFSPIIKNVISSILIIKSQEEKKNQYKELIREFNILRLQENRDFNKEEEKAIKDLDKEINKWSNVQYKVCSIVDKYINPYYVSSICYSKFQRFIAKLFKIKPTYIYINNDQYINTNIKNDLSNFVNSFINLKQYRDRNLFILDFCLEAEVDDIYKSYKIINKRGWFYELEVTLKN